MKKRYDKSREPEGWAEWREPHESWVLHQVKMAVGDLGLMAIKGTARMTVKSGEKLVKTMRSWKNCRPSRYRLLGCPLAVDVIEQWHKWKENHQPIEALKFGAMLLNVTQYVDSSLVYNRHGRIVAREAGLKGWLREHCNKAIPYASAIGYRKLAEVTARAIRLPEYLPLEWVLPGTEAEDRKRKFNPDKKFALTVKRPRLLAEIRACRKRLTELLEGAKSVNQLLLALDQVTGERRYRPYISPHVLEVMQSAGLGLEGSLEMLLRSLMALQAGEEPPPDGENVERLLEKIKQQLENLPA